MARKKKYPKDWFIVTGDIIIVDDEDETPFISDTNKHSVKKKKTKFPIDRYNEYINEQIKLVTEQPTTDEIRRLYAKASRYYSRFEDYESAIDQRIISPQYYYGAPQLGWCDDLEQCRAKCIELLKLSLAT